LRERVGSAGRGSARTPEPRTPALSGAAEAGASSHGYACLCTCFSNGKACAATAAGVAQAGKAGRSEPGAPANGGAPERSGAALAAWRRVAAPVARLLSPALRRTSLLLLLIWFTNALNYYGLVLLTTTVRSAT
jgi:hypothetical protein